MGKKKRRVKKLVLNKSGSKKVTVKKIVGKKKNKIYVKFKHEKNILISEIFLK